MTFLGKERTAPLCIRKALHVLAGTLNYILLCFSSSWNHSKFKSFVFRNSSGLQPNYRLATRLSLQKLKKHLCFQLRNLKKFGTWEVFPPFYLPCLFLETREEARDQNQVTACLVQLLFDIKSSDLLTFHSQDSCYTVPSLSKGCNEVI